MASFGSSTRFEPTLPPDEWQADLHGVPNQSDVEKGPESETSTGNAQRRASALARVQLRTAQSHDHVREDRPGCRTDNVNVEAEMNTALALMLNTALLDWKSIEVPTWSALMSVGLSIRLSAAKRIPSPTIWEYPPPYSIA